MGPMLHLAADLLRSPRVKESDTGARIVTIVFRKYCQGLGWPMTAYPDLRATPGGAAHGDAQLAFLQSLLQRLEQVLLDSATDLLGACRRSLAHNTLLTMRYCLYQVPWEEIDRDPARRAAMRTFLDDLAAVAARVTDRTLDILSKPQEVAVSAQEVGATSDHEDMGDDDDGGDEDEGSDGYGSDDGLGEQYGYLGPHAQVINTACWTSIKEVGLLVGECPWFCSGSASKECFARLPPETCGCTQANLCSL